MKIRKRQRFDELLRLKQVIKPHGPIPFSRSKWYDLVRQGIAPKPYKISKRISAYSASEIAQFIEQLRSEGRS